MQTEQKGINQETINRMELYRRILLQNGFSEPICQKERSLHWMFYKETTGNSAFVLNLTGYSDRVEIILMCILGRRTQIFMVTVIIIE